MSGKRAESELTDEDVNGLKLSEEQLCTKRKEKPHKYLYTREIKEEEVGTHLSSRVRSCV